MTRRTARPRDELVSDWFTSLTAAGVAPPPAAPTEAPEMPDVDDEIGKALDDVDSALAKALGLQAQDNDTPEDAKVQSGLEAMAKALADVKAAQAVDVAADAPVDAPVPVDPAVAAVVPDAQPGTAPEADVAPDVPCMMPTCAHMASSHQDTPSGVNTGPCQMEACVCGGMRVPDSDPIGTGKPTGQPPQAAQVRSESFAGPADPLPGDVLDPTTQTPGVTGSPIDNPQVSPGPLNDGPGLAIPTGALNGPEFTIPVLLTEGIQTSDGRMIQPGALTWRNPPLPLMGLSETNDGGHNGAVICGRIDKVWRTGSNICASGFFDTSEDGLEFARLVETGMIKGVSADIADTTSEVTVTEIGEDGFPTATADTITTGELMGSTICPFPAFAGAYIVLGDGTDVEAPIPLTPTPAQAEAGIHLLNTKACAPCEAGALVASAVPLAPPVEWFENPDLSEPTKLTVDDDGRVYGHLAAWGTCHIAAGGGRCVTPPRGTDYGFFRTGYVVTADGSEVATGPLTVDTGHASSDYRVTAASALAHYDNTGHAVADVAIGEDNHGIWLAGSIRPTATEEQVHELRASAVSGDWRPVGNRLELVAALCVNRPGFPITKAVQHDGEVRSLVAAGMVLDIEPVKSVVTDNERLARLEANFAAVAPLAAAALRERMAALRN